MRILTRKRSHGCINRLYEEGSVTCRVTCVKITMADRNMKYMEIDSGTVTIALAR